MGLEKALRVDTDDAHLAEICGLLVSLAHAPSQKLVIHNALHTGFQLITFSYTITMVKKKSCNIKTGILLQLLTFRPAQ